MTRFGYIAINLPHLYGEGQYMVARNGNFAAYCLSMLAIFQLFHLYQMNYQNMWLLPFDYLQKQC